MNKLVTDAPQDNIQAALNLFYIKDGWTWVRGGGPGPKYEDVSLCDYVRGMLKAHIPDAEIPDNDDDLSMMMSEWLMDGPDTIEGVIATLYTAGWAFAELRHRLKLYEGTGLEPEDLNLSLNAAIRKKVGAEYYGLTPERMDRAADLLHAEQEGRLMVLPCPIGTRLWRVVVQRVTSQKKWNVQVRLIQMTEHNMLGIIQNGEYGKTVFPSKQQAMAAAEALMKEAERDV